MSTSHGHHLGLDLGSTAVKAACLDAAGRVVFTRYVRHHGRPLPVAAELLRDVLGDRLAAPVTRLAVTGGAGRPLAEALGAAMFNEVVALATALSDLAPAFRTAIEVGGQDAKIIELAAPDAGAERAGAAFRDFAMNSECAAGTGSFLDQQAARLGVSIEDEFGHMALKSTKPPRVAGRCSVFAKTDMIHLQQQAVPDYDIVAGLCFGMARNFKASLARGRDLARPIAFVGGVAANAGMVRAFREVFELSEMDFRVPEHHAHLAAIGAVLCARRNNPVTGDERPIKLDDVALARLAAHREAPAARLPPLTEPAGYRQSRLADVPGSGTTNVYLGLDVGSISTKLVLMTPGGEMVAKVYLMTAGRPIEAVRTGLGMLGRNWADRAVVLGAATTGSGRYLTGDVVGADVVRNEITAQARGAVHVDAAVDTIFEIGGQDSKYIRLQDGVVVDFEMNHVCAAGTGSFLEEQAERLDISIKDEFARLALSSAAPIRLGERCTVFMESDLVHHQQQGAAREDLVAGLANSIAANYLNRVVGARSIGDHILFQGGTAFNRAVTAALEAHVGKAILVPPHHEVTGALGAALLARDAHRDWRFRQTTFRGFELADRPYSVRTFTCAACSNHCDIREVRLEGADPLFYGSRCDRYNRKAVSDDGARDGWPDLFAERERMLLGLPPDADAACCRQAVTVEPVGDTRRGVVGIPRALAFHQMLPFWRALLTRLGFEVLLSPATDAAIIASGVESVLSQTCFPVKVAHGHVRWLVDRGVDHVLIPSLLSLPRDHESQHYNHLCPYVQSLPYQIESALGLTASGVGVFSPVLDLEDGYDACWPALRDWAAPQRIAEGDLADALEAAVEAQEEFDASCIERGREVLAAPPEGAALTVLVSRPYNGCDAGLNLDVARRMKDAGLLAVPMDMLDLRRADMGDDWSNLFWKYGQRIIRAGQIIAERDELQAVYVSNFGCGPDSFLRRFFQEAMGRKPFLGLEIDEHSAPAGLVTRIEAFVDSLRGAAATSRRPARRPERVFPESPLVNGRTVLVPHMCDHAFAFAAAFRGAGLRAEVLPPSDEESMALGRQWTSGRECLPCIVTAGDMLRELQRPGTDPSRVAFFMPSGTGPCRFGMYNKLHRLILRDAGFAEVPILSPNQGASFYQDFRQLSRDPTPLAWQGIAAVDTLVQALHATRPYETTPGRAEAAYRECLRAVEQTLERGKDVAETMHWCANRFGGVAAASSTFPGNARPRVGVVGEIYVRNHAFSNQDIVRRLEALGLEVELAGFAEWIYYTNWTRKRRTRGRHEWRRWLGTVVKDAVQRRDERRIKRPFAGLLREATEPETADVLALGGPYIDDTFEGEACLSVGKAVELAHRGAAGVVNVMPFTCMPGNVVAAILSRLRRDLGDLPILSVAYDGQRDATLEVRLEAFAEQVKAFAATARPE